jgi:hypothetical protein
LRRDFWDLLQEFIKIDADTNNTSNYSSLAKSLLDVLRDRGEENDLLALLRKYLHHSSQWVPHHFRIDHVLNNRVYSSALVENILRAHLVTWEREYIQEITSLLDSCILITYRRTPLNGKEVNDLLQGLQKTYAFPSLRLGRNSQLSADHVKKLQFKLISLFCGAFQFWRIFLPPHEQQDLDVHPMNIGSTSPSFATGNLLQSPRSPTYSRSGLGTQESSSGHSQDFRNKIDSFFKEATSAHVRDQVVASPLFTMELKQLFSFLWQQFEIIENNRIQSMAEKEYLESQIHRTPSGHETGGKVKRQIKTSATIVSFDAVKDLYLQLAEVALLQSQSCTTNSIGEISIKKFAEIDSATFYQCSIFQEMINVLISNQVLLESQGELNHIDFVLKAIRVGYQGHPALCQGLDGLWTNDETRFDYPLIRLMQIMLDSSMHGESSLYLWHLIPDLAATPTLRALWTDNLRRPLPIVSREPAELLQNRRYAASQAVYEGQDDDDITGDGEHKCRNKLDFSYLAADGHDMVLVPGCGSQDAEDDNAEWSRLNLSQQLLNISTHDGGFGSEPKFETGHLLGNDVRFIDNHDHHVIHQCKSWLHHIEKLLHALSSPTEGDIGMLMELSEEEDSNVFATVKWSRQVDWLTLIVKEIASFLLFYSQNHHHHHHQYQRHQFHAMNAHHSQQPVVYPRLGFVVHMLQFLSRFDEDICSHIYILQSLNKVWLEIRVKYWTRFYVDAVAAEVNESDLQGILATYCQHAPDNVYCFQHDLLRTILQHYFSNDFSSVEIPLDDDNAIFSKDFGALWARTLAAVSAQQKFQVSLKGSSSLQDLSLFLQMSPEYSLEIFKVLQHYYPVVHSQHLTSTSFAEFLTSFQRLYPVSADQSFANWQHQIQFVHFLHALLVSSEISLRVNPATNMEFETLFNDSLTATLPYVEQMLQNIISVFTTMTTAAADTDFYSGKGDVAMCRVQLLFVLLRLGHHVLAVSTRFSEKIKSVPLFSPEMLRHLLRICSSVIVGAWLRQLQLQEQEAALVAASSASVPVSSSGQLKSFVDLLRIPSAGTNASSAGTATKARNFHEDILSAPDVSVFVTEGLVSATYLEFVLSSARYAVDLLMMMMSRMDESKPFWLELLSEPVSRVDWYFGQSNIALSLPVQSSSSSSGSQFMGGSSSSSSNAKWNGMNLLAALLWLSTLQSSPYTLAGVRALRTATLTLLTKLVEAMPQGEQMQSWFVQLIPPQQLSFLQQIVSHVLSSPAVLDSLRPANLGAVRMGEDVTAGWTFFATLVDNHPIALAMLLAVTEDPSRRNGLIIRTPSISTGSTLSDARFAQFEQSPLAKLLPLILPNMRILYGKDPVFLSAVLAFFQVSFVQALSFPIVAKFVLFLHLQVKNLWEALISPMLLIDSDNGNSVHYRSVDFLVDLFYLASEEDGKTVWEIDNPELSSFDDELRWQLYQKSIGYHAVLQHCESSRDMLQMLTQMSPSFSSSAFLLEATTCDVEDEAKQDRDKQLLLKRLFFQTGATQQLDAQVRQRNAQTQILIRLLDLMARERYGVLYELDVQVGMDTTTLLNAKVYGHPDVRQKCFAGWKRSFLQVSEPPKIVLNQLEEQLMQPISAAKKFHHRFPHQLLQYVPGDSGISDGRVLNYDGMLESVFDLSLVAQHCHTLHRLAVIVQGTNDALSLSQDAIGHWQRLHDSMKMYNAMYILNIYASASLLDLKRLASFKHFLQFFIIPGSHVHHSIERTQTVDAVTALLSTPSKDAQMGSNNPPAVGDLSPVTSLPDASPLSAKLSSFAGDKRSYDVIAELLQFMLPVSHQATSFPRGISSAAPSAALEQIPASLHPLAQASRCALWMWQERADLLLVMLHHQLHEVDFEDVDPSRSEVHLRQSGVRRMTQSKMEMLLQQLLTVFHFWFPKDHDLSLFFPASQAVGKGSMTISTSKPSIYSMQCAQQLYQDQAVGGEVEEEKSFLPLQILCELWTSMLLLCNGLDAQDTSSEVESTLNKCRQGCFEASFRLLLSLLQQYGVEILLHPPTDRSDNAHAASTASSSRSELVFRLAHLALQVLCASLPEITVTSGSNGRARRSISQTDHQRWRQSYTQLQVGDFLLQLVTTLEEATTVCLSNAAASNATNKAHNSSFGHPAHQTDRMMAENQQEYGLGSLKVTPSGLKLFDLHFADNQRSSPHAISFTAPESLASWMLNQASAALLTTLDIVIHSLQIHFLSSNDDHEDDSFCINFLQLSAHSPTLQYYQRFVQRHFDVSIAGIVMAYDVHHQQGLGDVSQLSRIWKRYILAWETILMRLREQSSVNGRLERLQDTYWSSFSAVLSRYVVLWVYPCVTEDALRMSFEQLALLRFTFRFFGVLNDTFPLWYSWQSDHQSATGPQHRQVSSDEYGGPEQYAQQPITWLNHVLYQRAKVWMARFSLVMMATREDSFKRGGNSKLAGQETNSSSLNHQQERLLSQCVVMRGAEENLLFLTNRTTENLYDSHNHNIPSTSGASVSNSLVPANKFMGSPTPITSTGSHHVHFGSNEVFNLPKSPERLNTAFSSSNGIGFTGNSDNTGTSKASAATGKKGILKTSSDGNLLGISATNTPGTQSSTNTSIDEKSDTSEDGVLLYVQEVEEAMLDVFQAMLTVLRQGIFPPFSTASNISVADFQDPIGKINRTSNEAEDEFIVKRTFAVGAKVFFVASAEDHNNLFDGGRNGSYYHHTQHHHHEMHPQQRIYCGVIERILSTSTGSMLPSFSSPASFAHEYEVRLLDGQSRERISAQQIVYEHPPLCPFMPLKKKLLFKDLFGLPSMVSLVLRHHVSFGAGAAASSFAEDGWLPPAVVTAIDLQIRAYVSHSPFQHQFLSSATSSSLQSLDIAPNVLFNHSQHVLSLSSAHLLRVLHTIVCSVQSFQQLQQQQVQQQNQLVWTGPLLAELSGRLRYLQELVAEVVYVLLATLDHHAHAPCHQHAGIVHQLQDIRKLWLSTFENVFPTTGNAASGTLTSSALVQWEQSVPAFPSAFPVSKLSFADDNDSSSTTKSTKKSSQPQPKKKMGRSTAGVDGVVDDLLLTDASEDNNILSNDGEDDEEEDEVDLLLQQEGRRGLMLRMGSRKFSSGSNSASGLFGHSSSSSIHAGGATGSVAGGATSSTGNGRGSGGGSRNSLSDSFSNLIYDDSDAPMAATVAGAASSSGTMSAGLQSGRLSNTTPSLTTATSSLSITKRFIQDMQQWMEEIALAVDADHRRLHRHVPQQPVHHAPETAVVSTQPSGNNKFRQGLRNPVNWVRGNQDF